MLDVERQQEVVDDGVGVAESALAPVLDAELQVPHSLQLLAGGLAHHHRRDHLGWTKVALLSDHGAHKPGKKSFLDNNPLIKWKAS